MVILDVAAAIIGILFWAERRSLATPIRPSEKENRNLRTSGPRHQRQTAMTNQRTVAARYRPAPVAAIAPSGLRAWLCFAFLIVAATIWYAAKGPLIVIGLLAGFFWSLNWLCHRSPRTMYWIVLIVEGLMKRPAKALGKRAPGASVHPGESLARELPCQQRPIVSVQHARYHGDGCRQHLARPIRERRFFGPIDAAAHLLWRGAQDCLRLFTA